MGEASEVRVGMAVRAADGGSLGTVERVAEGGFVADGRQIALDAVERVAEGQIYLYGGEAAYADADAPAERAEQREESKGLPNTDEPLYLNERPVEASLEDRLPDDRPR
jgi:hypothetical protein